jgi:peptidoglycan/LPS O-acetylase OafA/YrhL
LLISLVNYYIWLAIRSFNSESVSLSITLKNILIFTSIDIPIPITMSATTTQPKNHLLYIDSIRALTALYVVMHHAVLQFYYTPMGSYKDISDYHLSRLQKLIVAMFRHGHYAVDLFIVVSGFSLMLSVTKNGYLKGGFLLFLKRRAIRILPPYYFAMLLSAILIWLLVGTKTQTIWDLSVPIDLGDIITHIFVVHDFFSSNYYKINYPFWSIAVEFRIYLFFPLFVWIWKKWGLVSVVCTATIISIVGSLFLLWLKQSHSDLSIDTVGVSPYIILFTFGMFAADLSLSKSAIADRIKKSYQATSPIVTIIILGFFFAGCAVVRHYLTSDNQYFWQLSIPVKIFDIMLGAFFGFVLFICSIPSKNGETFWLTKILSWRPLVFIGTFSYSLYLIHAPLLALLYQYVILPLNLGRFTACMILFTGGTVAVTVVAYFFFYLFERPFLTMGKKTNIAKAAVIEPAP